ncbi:MAG: hypothetical protein ACLU4N_18805, partial [Butyricimonas faecihominis]
GLRKFDPDAKVRGWGGDLMREAGCEIVRHYKDTAIMGFLTVLKNLDKIKANIEACHQDILAWQPDVVILVDYGGFNLRVAKFIKDANIPVFYYISRKSGLGTRTGEEDQAVGGSYVRDFPFAK